MCESRKGISANQINRMIGRKLQNRVVPLPSHPGGNEAKRRIAPSWAALSKSMKRS
jgi:hypothetical protein